MDSLGGTERAHWLANHLARTVPPRGEAAGGVCRRIVQRGNSFALSGRRRRVGSALCRSKAAETHGICAADPAIAERTGCEAFAGTGPLDHRAGGRGSHSRRLYKNNSGQENFDFWWGGERVYVE